MTKIGLSKSTKMQSTPSIYVFVYSGVVSRRGHADYESIDQLTLEEVEKNKMTNAVVISTGRWFTKNAI